MRTCVLQAFQKSPEVWVLRFSDEGAPSGQRELRTADVDAFVSEVERDYRAASPKLQDLGRRLFEWLDGPTERWLQPLCDEATGLALHVDVSQKLRHLPWELLSNGSVHLGAREHRPFTPVRRVRPASRSVAVANRPLRVLLMACSPEDVQPVLDYEGEERLILEATRSQPTELEVEESGSLAGLQDHFESSGPGYFDVLHLTGHADVRDGRPCFIMETDTGTRHEASAGDIARAIAHNWPRLVFLSGCKTGQAPDQGSVPSLCEALVDAGAPAVLGWALPVGDQSASSAAATLYDQLAIGRRVDEAVSAARHELAKQESRYWHLLRLYGDATPLAPHVTPKNTPKRAKLRTREASAEFLDAGAKVEVCSRRTFVGRRRPLQRCLRILRSVEGDADHAEGILLHGMGGLGKSSMATRLCERMTRHRRIVWVGRVDEAEMTRVLSDQLGDPESIEILNRPGLITRKRLELLLEGTLAQEPALFVFDDFENALDRTSAGHVVKPETLSVLAPLLAAIRETASESRVIVTSRYVFPLPAPARLHVEGLESMRGADLQKKVSQLTGLQSIADTDARARVVSLSAGNPRLLERFDRLIVAKAVELDTLFDLLESTAAEFREELLLQKLLANEPPACRQVLARMAVYRLPVSRAAVQAAAGTLSLDPHLDRAVALGLVDAGRNPRTQEVQYCVSGVASPMVQPNVSENERRDASARGAAHLYADTGVDGTSLEGLLEIHRLALAGAETTVARDVADVIGSALIHQQRYRESARISGATLELGEDYRLLHNLGRAERVLGMATAALAHLERALAACPAPPVDMERSVTRERGAILFNLAELLAVKGEVARAMELYTESGQIDEHLGDTLGKSATLGNMAGLIAQQGDVTRAFELWGESLHLKELVGDVQGKATTLNNIATVIAEQGDVKRALELWNESLRIQELNGDLMGKATTLGNIGNVIARQGDVKRALELWDESLKLKELIGDVQGRSATLNNMAGVIERQGNVKRALELWDESLKLKELTGDVQGKAATLGNMAGAIARQGNIKRALELWTESLELNELIGDVQGKAVTLANMAWVAEQSGDRDRSRQLNLGAVRLLVSVKALPDVVTVLANLGNSEESVPFLAQALWLGRQVHAPARTLVGMASRLTEVLGTTHDAAKLIAASALLSALEKVDSEQDDLRQASFMLLAQVVEARGVAPEALAEWVAAERLTDAAHVASALDEALVALVGDGWLFDRAALDKPAG